MTTTTVLPPSIGLDSLADIAQLLVTGDKGLLAIDESIPTCNKRFARLGIAQDEPARRASRELILTTPGLGDAISGVILYDSDRVKLLAYKILDRTNSTAGAGGAGPPPTEPEPAKTSRSTKVDAATKRAFHTDPVYHDNDDCSYGIEIKNRHHDHPGTADRRQCAQRVAVKR